MLIFDWAVNNIRMGILDESPVLVIERAKVSILERAIPFAACAIASISGAFGGYRMVRVFTELARAEEAGFDVVFGAVNEINAAVSRLLLISIAICIGGIVFQVVRGLEVREKASSPGFIYLFGLPCLISPAVICYACWLMVDALTDPRGRVMSEVGATVAGLAVAAIPFAAVTNLIVVVVSLIPFRAKVGRKISGIVGVAILAIGMFAIASVFDRTSDRAIEFLNSRPKKYGNS